MSQSRSDKPCKRRLIGKFFKRTPTHAEELPNGDFLVTDETGTRTVSREIFQRVYMITGAPEYIEDT